jgi:conjugal transfer pilus assembly protein TraE
MSSSKSFVNESYTDLINTRRGYQLAILSLSLAVGLLGIMAFNKQVEVVVMPPDYWEPVVVNGSYANQSYAASHAVGIAAMIGNISEKNADFVINNFLKILSPYLRNQIEATLNAEVKILKTRKARQTFLIEDVLYEPRNHVIWVWGQKSLTFAGGGNHSERFTYEFRIEPKNGAPRVSHFDAYPGIPRTKDEKYTVEMKPYLSQELKLVQDTAEPASKAKYDVTPDPLADEQTPATLPTNEQDAETPAAENNPQENKKQ